MDHHPPASPSTQALPAVEEYLALEHLYSGNRPDIHEAIGTIRRAAGDAYLLGERFSAADIAAAIHLPVARTIASRVLQSDPFADIAGLDGYLARMEQRPTLQRIREDQRADQPHFYAHLMRARG